MPRIIDEPTAESPLWLEVAGYPVYLNKKIRKEAWPVFKKLVELDCAANARPDVFSAPLAAVAEGAGVDAKVIPRIVDGLRKEKMIRAYLPEDEGEEAMFQFLTPFHPPMDAEEVRDRMKERVGQRADRLRYLDDLPARGPVADSLVQQVVDAYLDTFGLKINSFVLDELALVAARFPVEWARDAFSRAVQTKSPSLRAAIHDLTARKRRAREKKEK